MGSQVLPQLRQVIRLTMQGYLLRNPVTDSSIDNLDIYDVFRWRPLIPQTLSDQLAQYNCGTLSNPIGEL